MKKHAEHEQVAFNEIGAENNRNETPPVKICCEKQMACHTK